ncbi:MAG: hypothetical protein HY673_03940 [Chloroflexi bacterium]|nr:hypothetical protein [Chloroflexota bacterium]
MIAQVRLELKDTNPADYKWTDNELTRFIEMALDRYSQAAPKEVKEAIATTSGSRVITPGEGELANVVRIHAVEYPIDKYPRIFQRFNYYAGIIELIGQDIPDGSDCNVYFGQTYDPDEETWTIPIHHERAIELGACAYAMLNWTTYITPSGLAANVLSPEQALANARQRMADFEAELRRITATVRPTTLYTPALPTKSQSTDWGP